ncbi:MAG TPA: type II toxin-antitoxin system RelE/ParE family toxin [Aquaticitalea sp.]|nr:type II toxin-antitoxin system RelE/ParE family toxin [Aquaticitalea sp.]HNU58982.1 type II toxin-antitoxin system RelE/ParE family toxin [Aquaticitalea sp.]
MSYKIINRPFVRQDIKDAVDYYKKISPKLAKEFIQRIREAKKNILQNPMGDDVMYKNIRMCMLRQFPYHIHYIVEEQNKTIVILAVFFAKRGNLDFSGR